LTDAAQPRARHEVEAGPQWLTRERRDLRALPEAHAGPRRDARDHVGRRELRVRERVETGAERDATLACMSVRSESQGHVTTIILHRPEAKNAVDGPTAAALAAAFRDFEADDAARVAVLWGDGGTFCAGADLKGMLDGRRNRLEVLGDGPMGPSRMLLRKPVIAAVAGHAVAGGLELAIWCDLRVVEESVTFGVFCRRWGVPLIDGGTVRLPRLIGLSRAMDLILTGRPVLAAEALAIGLANRVVANGTARAEAEALAAQIAMSPQPCMLSDRASAYESLGQPLDVAMKREFELGMRTIATSGVEEGAARFASGAGRGGKPA
jgi:enoyl-CoA hydratase